jgi:hypothetical protein
MPERSSEDELRQLLRSAYRHIDLLHKKNLSSAKAETAISQLQGEIYVLQWKLRDARELLSRVQPLVAGSTIGKQIAAFLAQPGGGPPVVPGGLAGYEEEKQKREAQDSAAPARQRPV